MCQFKEETRRLSSAKSRVDDAEMAQKMPKLRIKEFLRHTLNKTRRHASFNLHGGGFLLFNYSIRSNSLSHASAHASDGILRSPRGDSATEPILGPSGRQERLNCCWKNRR